MELKRYDGKLSTIDFLDLMMLDIYGSIRHVTVPKGYITRKLLSEGIGFDASNFGFAKVHDSDMVAIPDLATGFVGEVQGKQVLHCLCDVTTTDDIPFAQYPRNVARATVEHLKKQKIADTAQMLVERKRSGARKGPCWQM